MVHIQEKTWNKQPYKINVRPNNGITKYVAGWNLALEHDGSGLFSAE